MAEGCPLVAEGHGALLKMPSRSTTIDPNHSKNTTDLQYEINHALINLSIG
jgi:hypothetical protein